MAGFSGLQTGANGLRAHDQAMGVISDNLSNMNTTGFKSSQVVFQDMLSQAIGSSGALGANQVGTGSQVGLVNPNFQQGSFSGTSQATDMAIDGEGFFITEKDNGDTTYTRAGNFSVDQDGFLVGPGGARVQGWETTKQGGQTQIVGNVGDTQDINMQAVNSTAEATTSYKPRVNLDADADADNAPHNLADSSGTPSFDYHFKTDVTAYDSQGGSHVLSTYYTKTQDNEWDVRTLAKADEVDTSGLNYTYDTDGDNTDDLAQIQTSNGNDGSHLSFDTDGALANERDGLEDTDGDGGQDNAPGTLTDVSEVDYTTPWDNGSDPNQTIAFDMGTSTNVDGGNGLDGVVQRAGDSVLFSAESDGRATGSLQSFSVDDDGIIQGRFDNGTTEPLYKVALADFVNPDALERRGSNQFGATSQSGEPVIKQPNSGGAGSVRGYSLEDSNVNSADQFTKMIAIQRGYQANTKVITTVDEMLQSLMRVK